MRIQHNEFSVSGAFVSPNPIEDESSQNGKPTSRRGLSQIQDRRQALPTSRREDGRNDQRQEEEEEEELEVEEEYKEEEEETSQGQGEHEVDKNKDDAPGSPKSAVFSMGTESDQPDVVIGEKQTSDLEEPSHARRMYCSKVVIALLTPYQALHVDANRLRFRHFLKLEQDSALGDEQPMKAKQ